VAHKEILPEMASAKLPVPTKFEYSEHNSGHQQLIAVILLTTVTSGNYGNRNLHQANATFY
jgi:hypothetical protein